MIVNTAKPHLTDILVNMYKYNYPIFTGFFYVGNSLSAVSVAIGPWGSIFQNWILGGILSKFSPKKVCLHQNLSVLYLLEHTKIVKMHYIA